MKIFKYFLIVLAIIIVATFFNNKERKEKPINFRFIFENGSIEDLDPESDPMEKEMLKTLNDEILFGKRKLKEAYVKFENGELVTLNYSGVNLSALKVSFKNQEVLVPWKVLSKIKGIHYNTFTLLWEGRSKEALSARYFIIRFSTEAEKVFDKYPYI
jgi:hypothetical protein